MGAATFVIVPYSPVKYDFIVSTKRGQLIKVYLPENPAGTTMVRATSPQIQNCQRGENLSRNIAFTHSTKTATPETVSVCSKNDQKSFMGYTSISSSRRRSSSLSCSVIGSSFKNAATRSFVEPLYTCFKKLFLACERHSSRLKTAW